MAVRQRCMQQWRRAVVQTRRARKDAVFSQNLKDAIFEALRHATCRLRRTCSEPELDTAMSSRRTRSEPSSWTQPVSSQAGSGSFRRLRREGTNRDTCENGDRGGMRDRASGQAAVLFQVAGGPGMSQQSERPGHWLRTTSIWSPVGRKLARVGWSVRGCGWER
eukprot:3042313-Rhodomonas_salina.2